MSKKPSWDHMATQLIWSGLTERNLAKVQRGLAQHGNPNATVRHNRMSPGRSPLLLAIDKHFDQAIPLLAAHGAKKAGLSPGELGAFTQAVLRRALRCFDTLTQAYGQCNERDLYEIMHTISSPVAGFSVEEAEVWMEHVKAALPAKPKKKMLEKAPLIAQALLLREGSNKDAGLVCAQVLHEMGYLPSNCLQGIVSTKSFASNCQLLAPFLQHLNPQYQDILDKLGFPYDQAQHQSGLTAEQAAGFARHAARRQGQSLDTQTASPRRSARPQRL